MQYTRLVAHGENVVTTGRLTTRQVSHIYTVDTTYSRGMPFTIRCEFDRRIEKTRIFDSDRGALCLRTYFEPTSLPEGNMR